MHLKNSIREREIKMGSIGTTNSNSNGFVTESSFMAEAQRQGIDGKELQDSLEDYVTSSYGGITLGNRLTDFIENAPASMMYNKGTLYRGLMFNSEQELNDFLNSHKEGSTLKTRKDGLSWSANKNIASEFSTNSSEHSVILVNNDKNRIAMGIKNIADTPMISSEEVLYSNKVDFKVKRVERKNGNIYMYVEQKRSKK